MAKNTALQVPLRLGRVLYIIRWVVIIGLLFESRLLFTTARLHPDEITIAAGAMALLTLVATIGRKAHPSLMRPALIMIVDMIFVSLVVLASDGLQSPFAPLYYVVVITAAVLIGTRAAVLCAVTATAALLGMEAMQGHSALIGALVVDDVVSTFPYLFLIAVIVGTLMDRIRAMAETAARFRDERIRTESEMAIAQRVQSAQLPAHLPAVENMELTTIYKPAREVGGDTYDFYPIKLRRFGVMVADVSGKGVPAALLVASTKYAVREHYFADLAATLRDASAHISSVTGEDSFVTVTYGIMETATREFRYVNAGGMPPIVIKQGATEGLIFDHADPPIGIQEEPEYTVRTIQLEPGDTLVVYTDGLTDALSRGPAGVEKLAQVLVDINDLPLPQWRMELLRRIEDPIHLDDVTVVAVRAK